MKCISKIMALVLSGVLTLTAFAGCSEKEAPNASTPVADADSKTESTAESKTDEKPMDIKWLSFYGPETNDTYPQKFLEEKFNIKISNMIIDRNQWKEQLNVKLAGGDIPDIFWTWGANDVAAYQEQGVLAEVPQALVEEKMPSFAKSVSELEPRLWYNSTVKGKNYGVPLYWANGVIPQSPVYNKAWLTKIGAAVPKTLDEYVSVLTKFATEDPDGNGKKDTYGISFRGKDSPIQTMMQIYWAHGVPVFDWTTADEGDGITMSVMTKAWKDATAVIQKLYKDGAIDPESITDDNAQLTQKFANGRTGVLENGNFYHWIPNSGGYRIAADNAGVELEIGHLPVKADYYRKSNVVSGGVSNSIVCMGIQVEKDQPKMEKILEICEALHNDKDTYIATVFGKEGDHFKFDGDAIIRDPKVGDMIQQGTKFGVGTFYGMFGSAKSLPMSAYDYTKADLELKELFLTDTTVLLPQFMGSLTSSAKYPDIANLQNEHIIKFAIGELNLEADLEAFKTKWLQSGGEEMTKEANEFYSAQKK